MLETFSDLNKEHFEYKEVEKEPLNHVNLGKLPIITQHIIVHPAIKSQGAYISIK